MMIHEWRHDRDKINRNLQEAIVMTLYNHETYRVHILLFPVIRIPKRKIKKIGRECRL